jgi:hypothetical protein
MIWKDNLEAFPAEGFNFDGFKSRGLHEKYAATMWNSGIILAFP